MCLKLQSPLQKKNIFAGSLKPVKMRSCCLFSVRFAFRVMDEYVDLTEKEKRFMMLWNAFYRNVKLGPGDTLIPPVLEAFLETHGSLLKKEGLLPMMNQHLEMMRTYGVISDSLSRRLLAQVELMHQ